MSGDHAAASTASATGDAEMDENEDEYSVTIWCLACSRLFRTRADERFAACPSCGAPGTLEGIVDFIEAEAFIHGCHPSCPLDAGGACLTAVTIGGAGRDCAVCLGELEPGESALETPCEHVYHPPCITRWLEVGDTCPLCRERLTTTPKDGLVLCAFRDGRYGLGRRVVGRIFTVRILNQDGRVVRVGEPHWFTGFCRRVRSAAGAWLRREAWTRTT